LKIEHLDIVNYKSIKELHLDLNPRINVFIGANNVGKSNIMAAMEFVLGPTYPVVNKLDQSDFYCGNDDQPMGITLRFSDGNILSFDSTWTDYRGNQRHGLNLNNGFISGDDRDHYTAAFIGPDRRVRENPASNQWTLLGRMLKDFNARLYEQKMRLEDGSEVTKADAFKQKMETIRDDILFSIEADDGTNLMGELKRILQKETAHQLNCSPNDLAIDLNVYDPWNLFKTLQIYVTEQGSGVQMRAADMGMGVQASLTIAILRAYSKLELRNQTPIFIDEPELYLHPQARRKFYRVIEEVADSGTQVFITTHSTEFVDLGHFDQIYMVRKDLQRGTYVRQADPAKFISDLKARHPGIKTDEEQMMLEYRNAFENTGDSQKAAEALFASKILLVEGESESLIVPYCFDQIGYDYLDKGISIVRCGGKNELDRFYRLYSEFGIPCFILFDGDLQNKGTKDEQHTIDANHAALSLFNCTDDFPDGHVHDQYLGFTKMLENSLGIGEVGKSTKGLRLFKRFKTAVSEGVRIPQWAALIGARLDALPSEASSILLEPQAAAYPWDEDSNIPF
jgi:putative ATP-dependent endonuclease of OLD family